MIHRDRLHVIVLSLCLWAQMARVIIDGKAFLLINCVLICLNLKIIEKSLDWRSKLLLNHERKARRGRRQPNDWHSVSMYLVGYLCFVVPSIVVSINRSLALLGFGLFRAEIQSWGVSKITTSVATITFTWGRMIWIFSVD